MPVIIKHTLNNQVSQLTMSEDEFKDFSKYLEDNPNKQIRKMTLKEISKDLEVVVYDSTIDLSKYLTTKDNILLEIVNELEKSKHYEECYAIIRDAIIYGVFKLCYTMIAPYTHGYELTYFCEDGKRNHINYYRENTLKSIIDKTYDIFYDNKKFTYAKFKELIPEINNMKQKYKEPHSKISTNYHVNDGYEFTDQESYDAIINGKYSGTYSTMTPTSQNILSRVLIVLKDLGHEDIRNNFKNSNYFKKFVND